MTLLPTNIQEFINTSDLIQIKRSVKYPNLRVIKYRKKVFYDNLWHTNKLLLDCRGLVIDDDYNIVVHPFRKIFNYGENGTTINDDEMVTAHRKINGFMGCVTNYNGQAIFSTTGSLDSVYCDYIKGMIPKNFLDSYVFKMDNTKTWLFEIVHPLDPHIIKDHHGAWFLGSKYPTWREEERIDFMRIDRQMLSGEFGFKMPLMFNDTFGYVKDITKTCMHEGYVVYGKDTALKIKSPYYKTTKFLARVSNDKLIQRIEKQTIKQFIDEEFYGIVDYIADNICVYQDMVEQEKITFIESYFKNE
jgi:hypothetical protein